MTRPYEGNFTIPLFYRIGDLTIGACPRASSTSLAIFAIEQDGEMLEQIPSEAICIIREPLSRLQSSLFIIPESVYKDSNGQRHIGRPSIETVIDGVLDGYAHEVYHNAPPGHDWAWRRQSELFAAVERPTWLRLDDVTEFNGVPYPRHNQTLEEKPEITHRLDELREYYADDILLWEGAAP